MKEPESLAWQISKICGILMEAFRYVWSTCLLLFSLSVIIYAMINYETTFYPGVPNYVQIILLFILLILLGTMEGTMIALTQLRKVDPAIYKDTYRLAYSTAQYAYKGQRIERFLNGRQVIVVLCGFQLAYLTTVAPGGVSFLPYFLQQLLQTGLLGSFVVLILGQITPQIFAAKFPTIFLSLPILPVVFRLCLAIEFTGITYATWAIIRFIVFCSGRKFKDDVKEPVQEDEEEEAARQAMLALFEPLLQYLNAPTASKTDAIELDMMDVDQKDILPILVEDKLYASPKMLADQMDDAGLWSLSYLQPHHDLNYVPAHIVAAALAAENARLQAILTHGRAFVQA